MSVSPSDAREAELAVRRPLLRQEVENLVARGHHARALEEIARFRTETSDRSGAVLDLHVQVLEFAGELVPPEKSSML
ncbi:hypothetical protein [Lentzea sp. NPDC060358]|uniref:hypothetical protein n=1 Tax=Lentzea sp. NPDC060358 TaxID=3347103 RepID=UPI003655DAD9